MLEDILLQGLAELSVSFPEGAPERFRRYYNLLAERGEQMNLTSITGEEDVARLHFLDCAAVLPFFSTSDTEILDIGSGAGFPGLVLKILRPDLHLTLLDSLGKRVVFQREVCDALGLKDVKCLHLRAEEAPAEMRESFDVVISRAVARLNVLSELCLSFVRVNGKFIAMKGPAAAEELSESVRAFQKLGAGNPQLLSYRVPGLDAERCLVAAKKNYPTPVQYPRRFAQIKKQPL